MDHCDNCVIRETLNGSRNSARIPTNQSTPRVRTINRKEEKKKQRRLISQSDKVTQFNNCSKKLQNCQNRQTCNLFYTLID